jgi:hypothetical protein
MIINRTDTKVEVINVLASAVFRMYLYGSPFDFAEGTSKVTAALMPRLPNCPRIKTADRQVLKSPRPVRPKLCDSPALRRRPETTIRKKLNALQELSVRIALMID